jgi:hypothetical protein
MTNVTFNDVYDVAAVASEWMLYIVFKFSSGVRE